MNDVVAERYVNYFIRFILIICIIQSISIFYNKLILNKSNKKKSIELWWNGDQYRNDCKLHKDEFKVNIINNFITDKECDYIITISKDNLTRSEVGIASAKTSNVRTSRNYFLSKKKIMDNLILRDLSEKIAIISGYPVEYQEPFSILKYEKGDYYDSHYDTFNCENLPSEKNSEMLKCLDNRKKLGRRVASCILYLNTVEEGGATIFPNHGSHISAIKGKFIIWKNLLFNHTTDSCSLHMGSPPLKGVKWILVSWIRSKPWKT